MTQNCAVEFSFKAVVNQVLDEYRDEGTDEQATRILLQLRTKAELSEACREMLHTFLTVRKAQRRMSATRGQRPELPDMLSSAPPVLEANRVTPEIAGDPQNPVPVNQSKTHKLQDYFRVWREKIENEQFPLPGGGTVLYGDASIEDLTVLIEMRQKHLVQVQGKIKEIQRFMQACVEEGVECPRKLSDAAFRACISN